MKKITLALLLVAVVLTGFYYFSSESKERVGEEISSIPVVYPVTVDALQKVGEGISNQGILIQEISAEGEASRFSTVVDAAVAKKAVAIVTVGTQITNTVLGQKYDGRRPPIVAAAISDPSKLDIPEGLNISVISDNPKSTPDALVYISKRMNINTSIVGIITNKSEVNSVSTAKVIEDAYKAEGAEVVYGYINSAADIVPVSKKLLNKGVTVIAIPHDKYAVGNASIIVKVAMENTPPIPVISLDDGTVEKHGVLLGVSADYKMVGSAAASEIKNILKGELTNGVNIIYPDITNIVINSSSAKKLGLKVDTNDEGDKFKIIYH